LGLGLGLGRNNPATRYARNLLPLWLIWSVVSYSLVIQYDKAIAFLI
jgi:hypothetical protein